MSTTAKERTVHIEQQTRRIYIADGGKTNSAQRTVKVD